MAVGIFSEEQEEFRAGVRRFLRDHSPETEVRRLMASDAGFDAAVWRQLSDQLGLPGLIVSEAHGGSGFSHVELVMVLEEMGAALLCAPYFATVVLAGNALTQCADERSRRELLPALASGETIATLALTEDHGSWELDAVTLSARPAGDGWTLRGHKSYVLDGHIADLILVVARTPGGLSLFAVRGDAPGLTRTALVTIDETRKQARLVFDETPAMLVGTQGQAAPGLERTLDLAAVALAAEQVGGAQRCLDAAVAYAKDRVQFGRPIGSFQAIKHRCADMLVAVESARSAAYHAGWAAADDDDDLPVAASIAKAYCSEAFVLAATESIQIHGGTGFTWEHHAHLYFKRAQSSALLFGDPAYHRERLARRLGV
jgi:alkylation response protein AidB-like acyl-CoA dehydrogenase